jgi:hypothetical protein
MRAYGIMYQRTMRKGCGLRRIYGGHSITSALNHENDIRIQSLGWYKNVVLDWIARMN